MKTDRATTSPHSSHACTSYRNTERASTSPALAGGRGGGNGVVRQQGLISMAAFMSE